MYPRYPSTSYQYYEPRTYGGEARAYDPTQLQPSPFQDPQPYGAFTKDSDKSAPQFGYARGFPQAPYGGFYSEPANYGSLYDVMGG